MLIHHKTAGYDTFRAAFDDDAKRRKRLGSQGGWLLRSTAGPNDLFALFEWDDVENARRFADSYEPHEAFEWALPVEETRTFILEGVDEVEL